MILNIAIISSFFTSAVIIFTSCASGQRTTSANTAQVIEDKLKQFLPSEDTLSTPFFNFNEKVWYQDSMAIEEVRYLKSETAHGKTVEEYPVRNYRFNDLKKRVVYEYKNFSDTAKLMRKYSYEDTSIFISSGWNFKYIRHWDYNGEPQNMPDTVMDKINYKRVRLSRGTDSLAYIMICYFRCDMKGTVFTLDPFLSEKVGCPLVQYYHFSTVKKGLHILNEVKFLADHFTAEESKVFNAWKKYANENPVVAK